MDHSTVHVQEAFQAACTMAIKRAKTLNQTCYVVEDVDCFYITTEWRMDMDALFEAVAGGRSWAKYIYANDLKFAE